MILLCLQSSISLGDTDLYGEQLSDARTVRISEILSHPDRYVDRKVKIAGLVDDVCPMKGCWIDILARGSEETLRFKVEDDVIVFPVAARGRDVVAEGVLRKHELSREQAVREMRHMAEERDEAFDEASVTGPMVIYQIEGAGAEVNDET